MSGKISLDSLINEIKDAFGDLPCPKDEDILLEGLAEAEYCGNRTAGLSGVRWLDFPGHCYSKKEDWYCWPWITDLTPTAYHYYLPGYMLIAAQHYNKCDSDGVVASLILNIDYEVVLSRTLEGNNVRYKFSENRREKFELFTLQQKHTIKLFLESLIEEYHDDIKYMDPELSPQEALAQYWGGF